MRTSPQQAPGECAVSVERVSFAYGDHTVLADASLTVNPLDFVGIVGPNGGGKTTLMKLILGLLRPLEGSIRVLGERPDRARRRIGYVPQSIEIDSNFPITVREVVMMGRLGRGMGLGRYRNDDHEAADSALESVGMLPVANASLSDLSGGQRQRVFIARGLAAGSDMLILDEPTANVDAAAEDGIHAILQRLNEHMTIILVTHDLSFVTAAVQTVYCVNRRVTRHQTADAEDATDSLLRRMYTSGLKLVQHDACCDAGDPA